MQTVCQIVDRGLEHGCVMSEEPDVVHPAKMREDCAVHLQIVSSAADDVTRFLSVPLFCQL